MHLTKVPKKKTCQRKTVFSTNISIELSIYMQKNKPDRISLVQNKFKIDQNLKC